MKSEKQTPKNRIYANKGAVFEQEIIMTNAKYETRGIAMVQKISTPWQVVRDGSRIMSAEINFRLQGYGPGWDFNQF
ncbi:Holliday junction resolvase RecU [Dehalobacterium formicoaceticum]|uniref:Holliday junction resolvase RecU n=1 Tax=Dehalobacterium formicoaceticum TaxID=51515 RepID=UPI0018DF957C|nr:Holliday junction resolvase RecU [Dehalobacterium formicoaceticum]